ncbi:MAG: RraA family protein [Acidimicrobiia bacterium]|nr:RraA family protein [Acidimicrobiia bacterium]
MPEPGATIVETSRTLLALGAATLGESGGRPMRASIKPSWSGAALAAPAFPVRCTPGDNLAIHVAVARAPEGHALVVDVGPERELGYWGEVLTTAAEARGLTGLVIDGCVRDAAALAAHGFPVFSTGLALPGATKARPGSIGTTAPVGGVEVTFGDWVVGDVDGVTVVPGDALDDVLAAGNARAEKEAEMFVRLRDGATTLDLLALDATPIDEA